MTNLFRVLTTEEEAHFRQWARDNASPEWFAKAALLHPVVRREWHKMRKESQDKLLDFVNRFAHDYVANSTEIAAYRTEARAAVEQYLRMEAYK